MYIWILIIFGVLITNMFYDFRFDNSSIAYFYEAPIGQDLPNEDSLFYRTIFTTHYSAQDVYTLDKEKGILKFTNCNVIDKDNWDCIDETNSKFGFYNGLYFFKNANPLKKTQHTPITRNQYIWYVVCSRGDILCPLKLIAHEFSVGNTNSVGQPIKSHNPEYFHGNPYAPEGAVTLKDIYDRNYKATGIGNPSLKNVTLKDFKKQHEALLKRSEEINKRMEELRKKAGN